MSTDGAAATASPGTGPRLVVVEDHELLAQSLAFALEAQGVHVTRCEELTPEAILETIRSAEPDMVLLDLDLGAHGTSLPLIAPVRELGTVVVMLTASVDRPRLAACVEAGAVGVISKAEPFDRLLVAVTKVLREHSLLSLDERRVILEDLERHRAAERARFESFAALSDREAVVLQGLIEGRSAEQIAGANVVSLATVRTQIRSVLVKLGVNSQLSAVALARRAGWSLEQR
jgi:DNA-binding NarL/FixJ family response regulator